MSCGPCKCELYANTSLFIVDCSSSMSLNEVPLFGNVSISDITELNLANNNLSLLTATSASPFAGFINLTTLDLSNSSISMNGSTGSVINAMTFAGLASVEELDVSNNHNLPFTHLTDSDLFKHLTSLKILRMYGTTNVSHSTEGYPNKLWSNVPTLEEIWIDGLPFAVFGEEFKRMPNLKTIRITGDLIDPPRRAYDYCNIVHINNEMLKNLEHVSNLSIVHCNVHSISDLAFDGVKNLSVLDLSCNLELGFVNASMGFGHLNSGLKMLVLNNINRQYYVIINESFAKSLQNISLTHLYIEGNNIFQFHENAFINLPISLKKLYAGNNRFDMDNYLIYLNNLTNLELLDLSLNKLTFYDNNANHDLTDTCLSHLTERPKKLKSRISTHKRTNAAFIISGCLNQVQVEIPAALPPKLETLDVHSSNMGLAVYGYMPKNNSLKTVYASNALLNSWPNRLPDSISLAHLDLSSNLCSDVHQDLLKGLPFLEFLDLSGNYLSLVMTKYGDLFENNTQLKHLDISKNELTELNNTLFKNQINMTFLNLSQNKLKSFSIYADNLTKLQVINLSQNCFLTLTDFKQILHVIRNHFEKRNETVVDLRNNDFLCSCDADDVAFMNSVAEDVRSHRYLLQFTCNQNEEVKNTSDFESFKHTFDKKCRTLMDSIVLIVVGVVFVLIFLIITVATLVFKFRWKIKYWFYVRNSKRRMRNGYTVIPNCNDWAYKYHVYLAYSYEVQEFIIGTVLTKLSELGYKVFSQEDIIPGLNLCSVIGNAIHVSRCVLFVVSSGCEDSNEWSIAVHMANEEAIKRRKHITLALLYGHCVEGIPGAEQLIHQDYFIDFPLNGSEHEVTAFWADFEKKLISIDNTALETSMTCLARNNERS
ncbi:hypothetical protein DPMN_180879 [Dreissena polymorpha]|uniref:TIR domain-containing protein n=2 Tax=Dreissena polymorpha TaxID=45954 RepID=A0A9D4I120_DREPO|nr:hypothetical protein DPMN_180879 [Dreissena polymorpha]